MLGTLYASSSDFSSFTNSRDLFSSHGFCLEQHDSEIEERYCPNQHFPNGITDKDWDLLVAHESQLYDAFQSEVADTQFEGLRFHEEQMQTPVPLMISSSPLAMSYLLDTGYVADADTDAITSPSLTPSPVASNFSEDLYQLPHTPVDVVFHSQPLRGHQAKEKIETPEDTEPEPQETKIQAQTRSTSRKRTKPIKTSMPRKRLCRASSATSISTISSVSSSSSSSSVSTPITSANAPLSIPNPNSTNPWKCPHCSWIQHTKRLPDFLRHQRSHFVSESDWPCPNPKCGKGFARKDSLKRHLDNRATGCKRPPGYTIC